MAVNFAMKTHIICPPDNVQLGQAVDVTVNYLRAHPEKRQVSAASMAIVALTKAFPLPQVTASPHARWPPPYRGGRSDHWIKVKNPAAPAVRRLEEEDWN